MEDYYSKFGRGIAMPDKTMQYLGERAREAEREDEDFLGAAFSEAMSPAGVKRIWERRSSQFKQDEDWELDDEIILDLQSEYSPDEIESLQKAKSKTEFVATKKYIKEDRERLRAIGKSGLKGLVATIGFSMIDPVGLALGAATGSLGWGAKMTGVAKAMRVGAMTGIENAAIETVLMQGSTQSKASDVMMAFGVGGAIGAGLSPFMRSRYPKAAKSADEADEAAHMDADANVADEILQEARSKEAPEIDMRLVRKELDEYEQKLKRETAKPMTKGQIQQTRKRMKELQEQVEIENENIRLAQGEVEDARAKIADRKKEFVEEVNARKTEIETSYAKRIEDQKARVAKAEKSLNAKDSRKKAAKLWKEETELEDLRKARDFEIRKVEGKYRGKVKAAETRFNKLLAERAKTAKERRTSLQTQMSEQEVKLQEAKNARDSMNKLRKWGRMNEEERVATLFDNETLPRAKQELDRQIKGYSPLREAVREDSTITGVAPETAGTVGAMRAGQTPLPRVYDISSEEAQRLAKFAYDGSNMPEDLRGRQFLGTPNAASDKIYAAQTIVSNSKDYAIRGFGYHLFEAPQGGTSAPVTVSARVYNNTTQIRGAMKNRLNEGIEEWGSEQGINRVSLLLNKRNFQPYHKMVMLEVKRPGTYNSEAVRKGAEGVRDQLAMAGKINKESGVAGFEGLDLDKNYVPTIIDSVSVKSAIRQHGKPKVRAVLSKAYQEGHFKLDEDLADTVADGYIERALKDTLTLRDHVQSKTGINADDVIARLKKAGVDQETIDDFIDSTMEQEIRQTMSNRAKKSLYPELDVEENGLKMIDLVDNDLPKLLESYTREAAGGAAFSKLGFRTRSQILDHLTATEKAAINNGGDPAVVAREIQILRDGVDLAYGRSLNKNPHSKFVRNLDRIRNMTRLLRLIFVGPMSIPELARITAKRELNVVLRSCKDLGAIRGTKNLRKGGKYSGEFERPDLRELDIVRAYAGEDHVLYPNGLRTENIEEVGDSANKYGRFGELLDNMLAQGGRIQEIASALRMIQGTGEKLSVRSLALQVKNWADDVGKPLSQAEINRAGWGDGFADELKQWMKDNPKTEMFEGEELRLFNFGEMSPEMQERVQIGINRMANADMQRLMVGESPMFMHKWLGQTVTQFRGFSILSLEKQLVHDIRHDKIAGTLIALHSAALAYGALSIKTLHKAIGREDRDEYIKKRLASQRTIFDVMGMMGQLASLQTGMDAMATLGLFPDASSAFPGGRVITPTSVPAVGLMRDVAGAARSIPEFLLGEADGSELLKDFRKVVPFANAVGINQALNVVEQQLEE